MQTKQVDYAAKLRRLIYEYEQREYARGHKPKNKKQIAEALGISITTLAQHLTGRSAPNTDSLRRYAEFFGITLQDFFLEPRFQESDLENESRAEWSVLYERLRARKALGVALKLLRMIGKPDEPDEKNSGNRKI